MSEFLIRKLNVAIPEVDLGDDIVVVQDDDDLITRVQVKTANASERGPIDSDEFDAQFSIPIDQLVNGPPNLVYAFVVRRQDRWVEFVVIRRSVLNLLRVDHDALSGNAQKQTLNLTFSPTSVFYKNLNFQAFRGRFDPWPPRDEIPAGVVS